MPIATVNRTNLAYDVAGAGPAIVFLHEGIADRTMWEREVAQLARDHRVVNPDLRGYGESDLPKGPAAWHEDVTALMAALDISRATLVGASVGASIALNVALSQPDAVAGLVLMAPGIGGRRFPAELAAAIDAIDATAAKGDYAGAAEETLRLWLDGPSRPPGTVGGALRDRLRRINAEILRREQSESEGVEVRTLSPSAAERLGDVRVPTLVIVGSDDAPFIQENARLVHAAVPGAELVVIENAAHMPNLEHPERVGEALRGFLEHHRL